MVNSFMRGQLAAVPAALYRERYPAIKTLDAYYGPPEGPSITGPAFKGVAPEGNVIARNVCVGKWFEAGWHATSEPSQFDLRDNYITTNLNELLPALPSNPQATSFKLDPASPLWRIGFKPIPLGQIGIRQNPDRD
jgi:hypothetical protein